MYQQQEPQGGAASRSEQESPSSYGSYGGYESYDTPKSSYPTDSKSNLSQPQPQQIASGSGPSWGQRLALMIVSMSLWALIFIIIMSIAVGGGAGSSTLFFLCFGLLLFTVVVVILNITFINAHH